MTVVHDAQAIHQNKMCRICSTLRSIGSSNSLETLHILLSLLGNLRTYFKKIPFGSQTFYYPPDDFRSGSHPRVFTRKYTLPWEIWLSHLKPVISKPPIRNTHVFLLETDIVFFSKSQNGSKARKTLLQTYRHGWDDLCSALHSKLQLVVLQLVHTFIWGIRV